MNWTIVFGYSTIAFVYLSCLLWTSLRKERDVFDRARAGFKKACDAIDRERAAFDNERRSLRASLDNFKTLSGMIRKDIPNGPSRAAWLYVADTLDRWRAEADSPVRSNARGGDA